MSDDVFRIVIMVAVALACLAFLIQAGVIIALYGVVSKMQKKMSPVLDRADEIGKAATPVIAKAGAVIEKAHPLLERAGPVLDSAKEILKKTEAIIDEIRPKVAEISTETAAIVKSSRLQVDRIGELLGEAGSRAKERLEQIDRSVDNTVEHLEQAGDVMKRAVMRPVKEVNGLAAGISAAVSALAHGKRRQSVDHATQDEEMFI